MINLFATFLVLVGAALRVSATPLDDYVWKPDATYKWEDMGIEHVHKGVVGNRTFTSYCLNMTSQKWLSDDDFTANSQAKSIWWHYLVILVPENIQYKSNGSLYITGSDQGSQVPDASNSEDVKLAAALALTTGTITGVLFQVPNEHITFSSDPILKSRGEDAIIAFTWDHFLKDPSQPEWLVRFPMVKAAIRALDTMKSFVLTKFPEKGVSLDYFSVAGASKRGWTTWLVGAVDPDRVKIIVPIVLDAINFVEVEHHQFRSYGGWTYALQDYIDMNITTRFDDPNMRLLQEYEDPYFYLDRLTMPKFVVNAAMDEFQQPDDTHYWWKDLPEPKHFLIAPNVEHSMATGIFEIVPAIGAFILSHLKEEKVPKFDWTIDSTTGEIVATLSDLTSKVHEANVWWSYSCGENNFPEDGKTVFRRDYRVAHLDAPCNCGLAAEGMCANLKSFWHKEKLEMKTNKRGQRYFSAQIQEPGDGRWVAFFIDIQFHNKNAFPIDIMEFYSNRPKPDPLKPGVRLTDKYGLNPDFGGFPHDFGRFFEFTTEVSVWPNTFPYPDCSGAACGDRIL